MSKLRMSVRSRRMVRRNREFFRLMDETGLTADELRSALATREALAKALASVSSAALDVARSAVIAFSPVVSALDIAFSPVAAALEAALRADEEEEERRRLLEGRDEPPLCFAVIDRDDIESMAVPEEEKA